MKIRTTSEVTAEVAGRMRDLRQAIYGDDPRSVAPGDIDPGVALNSPAFNGRRHIVQATDGETTVAQAVARLSPELDDASGRPVGTIGNFDARVDSRAAEAVLERSIEWLKERGAGRIVGPMNGSVWRGYRFSVGPHEAAPCLMEPYNPPRYPVYWHDSGFEVCKTFHTNYGEAVEEAARKMKPGYERARQAGYSFTSLADASVEDPLAAVYRMLTTAFEAKEFYTPISESSFRRRYGGLEDILDPGLVWFAHSKKGRPAGFVFALPNYHRAVAAKNALPRPVEKLGFLWHARPEDVGFHTVAVTPEHRGHGVAYGLSYKLYETTVARGYSGIYGLLVEDGNPSDRLGSSVTEVVRRYVLYEYEE